MATCYILYSKTIDQYYIGATQHKVEERISKHNKSFYGQHFTSKATDWSLYFSISCVSFKQACAIEKHIKRMKSKTYILNLRKYPEMVQKLLLRYKPT
ncbi:MAG: GIY-YIG nuclease family protein [Cyclobacteriaceae bacterium]